MDWHDTFEANCAASTLGHPQTPKGCQHVCWWKETYCLDFKAVHRDVCEDILFSNSISSCAYDIAAEQS